MKKLLPALFLFVVACKKESAPDPVSTDPPPAAAVDTIYPGNYYPVHPGSYWVYLDVSDSSTDTTFTTGFVLDEYNYMGTGNVSAYVPVNSDQFGEYAVWGYKTRNMSGSTNSPLEFLREPVPVGTDWDYYQGSGFDINRKIKSVGDTLVVQGIAYSPVICVEEYYAGSFPYFRTRFREYYALNVGMIKQVQFLDVMDSTQVKAIELEGYYIHP